MPEIAQPKFYDCEVAKVADFSQAAALPALLACALLDGANQDVENSFVLSGLDVEQASPASMNVIIKAGLGFDRFSSKFLHLNADLSIAIEPSSPVVERIDTIEVRFLETGLDTEARAFKDPENGNVSYANVATKTLVSIEAKCLAGTPGAGSAPLVELGWVKLAEIRVQAAAGAIYTADIRGITAQLDAAENAAWTAEKADTFALGSVSTLKSWVSSHLGSSITSSNTVHGIRQGAGNGLDSDKVDGFHASQEVSPSTAVVRDAFGRAQIANPSVDADIANKGWTRDFVYPVGSYYTQFPDASSNDDATEFPTAQRPATLFGGTWAEQWAAESVYFRTRGTLSDDGRWSTNDGSNPSRVGKQEDAFQGHRFYTMSSQVNGGGFSTTLASARSNSSYTATFPAGADGSLSSAPITDGTNGTPRTAAETRVVNRRIKVWKRTA